MWQTFDVANMNSDLVQQMNSSQGLNLNVTALHQQQIVALYVV